MSQGGHGGIATGPGGDEVCRHECIQSCQPVQVLFVELHDREHAPRIVLVIGPGQVRIGVSRGSHRRHPNMQPRHGSYGVAVGEIHGGFTFHHSSVSGL